VPRGENLFDWMVIVACLAFMFWWPYYQFRKLEKERDPALEECPRCGRQVQHIDLHVRYCRGQIVRRNPLSGALSTIRKSFRPRENVDVIPGPRGDQDEEL
jgi:hypothetical protein